MSVLVLRADLTREPVPDRLWRSALDLLDGVDLDGLTAVEVTGPPGSLVLWDTETLGSPRAALLAPDPRADLATGLAWIAMHEPHTWALVQQERYAVGPLASYLVARLTRGLHHVTTDRSRSAERATELGVPPEVLPDLVAPGVVATTDPRVLRGLALPIRL